MQHERDGSWSWRGDAGVLTTSQTDGVRSSASQRSVDRKKGEDGVSDGGRQNGGDAPVYMESGSITNIFTVS